MEGKVYSKENPKKPTRSISGVTPLTVVLKPRKCNHGTCIYCPGGDYVPQSYTDKSPAIMRALTLEFDPYKQVKARLNALHKMGHPTDKIEIIVLGGTFLQYEIEYQYDFIKRCFDALNGVDAKDLAEAKKINEIAEHRCVAMCIENRPDNCSPEEIDRMLEFGATRTEIGIQILDDEIYKKVNRGHKIEDVVNATRNLKNAGFKTGYHVMPGLPYSNPKKDIEKFKMIFLDSRFRPDQLKIYPCQIVDNSPLAKIYKKINYMPYDDEITAKILTEMMQIIPEYCRVMRVMREIPKEKMVVTPLKLELRKEVEEKLREAGIKINEIRMREIGFNKGINNNIFLKTLEYEASEGKEYFLQLVNEDNVLFGLLRLRISENGAMIRELHVYGKAIEIGVKGKASQHKGFGKWLMDEAEKIAREKNIGKISVISGIGVREYYRKLGYELEGFYMVKKLQ